MARIKNDEEYEEKKGRLNELVDRYKWLVDSKDPIADLREEQEIYVQKYTDKNLTTSKALEIESALQKIGVQSMYINGRGAREYESILMSEIQALILDICQYEANKRLSEKTPWETLKAIITGDEETKKDLKYKRAYGYGEDIGYVGKKRVIDLTPPEMILERMSKQIDWAKLELITDEEKIEDEKRQEEELSLVVSDEKSTSRRIETMQMEVQERIKDFGLGDISVSDNSTKKDEKEKNVIDYGNKQRESPVVERERDSKGKDDELER